MREIGFYENIGAYLSIILMLAAGIFGLLLAFKKIDLFKGKPEGKVQMEKWHKENGKLFKIVSVILICVAIFQFVLKIMGI